MWNMRSQARLVTQFLGQCVKINLLRNLRWKNRFWVFLTQNVPVCASVCLFWSSMEEKEGGGGGHIQYFIHHFIMFMYTMAEKKLPYVLVKTFYLEKIRSQLYRELIVWYMHWLFFFMETVKNKVGHCFILLCAFWLSLYSTKKKLF